MMTELGGPLSPPGEEFGELELDTGVEAQADVVDSDITLGRERV